MSVKTNTSELSYEYDWFQRTFAPLVQSISDDFFAENFSLGLLGICKNANPLATKEAFFVTKVRIDRQHDLFFRMPSSTVKLILDRILGAPRNGFNLDRLTELETKILTTFNDCLYNAITPILNPPPPTLTRTNFDVINLIFVIVDKITGESGRFAIALPQVLLAPEKLEEKLDFPTDTFEKSIIKAKLYIGSTTFSLHDLKNLEEGDTVGFENSDVNKMKLSIGDWETDLLLKPNLSLVLPIDNDGGSEVSEKNVNIWDSIEVEMVAHFEGVGITLGELKKIQAGMVLDLATIYNSKVTLTVEDKKIASGDLVIINDKYGVKITDVYAPKVTPAATVQNNNEEEPEEEYIPADEDEEIIPDEDEGELSEVAVPDAESDEDFDYSDFDLEEDI